MPIERISHTHTSRFLFCNLLILLTLFAFSSFAFAEEYEGDKFDNTNYPESISGPRLMPYTSFRFSFGYGGSDEKQYSRTYEGVNYLEYDQVVLYALNVGGSIAILDRRLQISADIQMGIVTGDQSGFIFQNFGLGVAYVVYNVMPVAVTVGLDLNFRSQSYSKVYSGDVFNPRPYVATGISVWRFYFSPYLGFPMHFDINDGNDNDNKTRLKRETNDWDKTEDYLQGMDYGIPISFQAVDWVYITLEPSGHTWIYPDSVAYRNVFYLTPGVIFASGNFTVRAGLQIRLYPDDMPTRRWNLLVNGGLAF